MDRTNRLLRAACTALTAALMAGCAAYMTAHAMGFDVPWLSAYALALAASVAVQLIRRGGAWAIGAGAAAVVAFGALLAVYVPEIAELVRALPDGEAAEIFAAHAAAGRGVACIGGFGLGMLLAGLMRAPSGAPFALLVVVAAVICALAVEEEISLWAALPGLAAGAAAFGLPSDARRDGIAPALLVPAALLALLALALVPGERITWEPLERLAERVRSIVEEYVRFTEERMAFSINEKGFDRAGMIGDSVVAMLGGPANPTDDLVMRVETDADLLLRGTIKRTYTGYSWVDDQTKARYLYYDFTHRRVRSAVFDADTNADSGAFVTREAAIEMLGPGTSTLFVPAQLAAFDMDLTDAVYYNSTGEIFLTRDVAPGDRYKLTARVPASEAELVTAAAEREGAADDRWAAAYANYTELPANIDSRVYALAAELTQNTSNAAEKAFAIQNYLAQNYRYTLDGGYPEGNTDFVSWFLLESKEGYCSYFASAMAVICRMAGLPARYVEGYAAEARPGGAVVVTGENAHAWVEVYLNGMGWVAFDPTARARELQGDGSGSAGGLDDSPNVEEDETSGLASVDPGAENPSPSPDSGPTPTPDPDSGDPEPSPTPEDGELPPDSPEDPPEDGETPPDNPDPQSDPEKNRSHVWLWVLLIVLLLLALIALIVLWLRRRLERTDPLLLSKSAKNMDEAALILYRAMLTLLNQQGLAPQNGETPEAFAGRVSQTLPNPDYERFVREVARCRYAGQRTDAAAVACGRRAYAAFLNKLRRSDRLRFHARRALRGLGSTEMIP